MNPNMRKIKKNTMDDACHRGRGRRCILSKTCLVIGAGGLASVVLPYLAGAGVGHIKIIDFDKVNRREPMKISTSDGDGKIIKFKYECTV